MREVCWLCQKCDLHKEAVQERRNLQIVRVSRTQCGELPTHLDEIKRFVVRLLFQLKRPVIKRSAAPNMLARRLRLRVDPDGAMSRVRKTSEGEVRLQSKPRVKLDVVG